MVSPAIFDILLLILARLGEGKGRRAYSFLLYLFRFDLEKSHLGQSNLHKHMQFPPINRINLIMKHITKRMLTPNIPVSHIEISGLQFGLVNLSRQTQQLIKSQASTRGHSIFPISMVSSFVQNETSQLYPTINCSLDGL
jgi:hypothetical protein